MTDNEVTLLRELRGTACRCGRTKAMNQTFCRSCYFLLPGDIRRGLYKRLGKGYAEEYARACDVLGPVETASQEIV